MARFLTSKPEMTPADISAAARPTPVIGAGMSDQFGIALAAPALSAGSLHNVHKTET
jgi:hypothetical protein